MKTLSKVEHGLTQAKFKIKDNLNLLEAINIMPYYGFGSAHYVFVKGRVLEDENVPAPKADDNTLSHIKNTYKRYESDEIPGAKVKASFAGYEQEVITDAEGYFDLEFRSDVPINYSVAGQKVKLQLQERITPHDDLEAEAYIFTPGKDAEFGIISDIDDTVLVSRISDFLGKLRIMLMKNALERSPFPGIAGFLRALCKGSDGEGHNPLFYVSGSEWNLYDLLINFFEAHDIPAGPLLLRDKGTKLDRGKFETSEEEYKQEKIRHILDTYPDLQFICIGDSGQQDPETYQKIVQEYPGRILGVYIRDVTPNKRDKEVNKIAVALQQKGVEMKLVEETFSAARHALEMGWINESQLEQVKRACEADEQEEG
ncbi:App1 family protein [Pontibacter sp. CAU 1760]